MTLRQSFASTALAVAIAASLAFAPAPAIAKDKKGDKPKDAAATAAAAAADKPYGDWKKLTKDTEVMKGFFTAYKKRENLYLEIRADQFDKPFLAISSLARGIGSNFVLGGLPLDDRMLEFQRSGDRVLVIDMNTRFMASKGGPMANAVALSLPNSVLASLKVESVQDSTKAVLVDFASFLVSDVTDVAERLRQATTKSMRFDKERSAVTSAKMFPDNFETEALLTYSPNDRMGLYLEGVPDERFVPITVHYSFSKLPDVPMQPRLADERVGYFLTAMKDFSKDDQENFWVRYVNRWRLDKKDPAAAVSEPVKPIVFYMDHTIPTEYRPYVKQGVENWQKAYEAAGFKNAIIAKDAPNDSLWDAEDVRYSTIRWITSTQPAFGAIGPSRVDPRSGEILDADILFEASMIQGFRTTYRRWTGPDAWQNQFLPETRMKEWPAGMQMDQMCEAEAGAADGASFAHLALLMQGAMPPGSPVPEDFLKQAIVWVTMHEVGHSLGLRHNFRSSTSTPEDKLNDKTWVAEHGLYSSVMEYPTPNIAKDRTLQGYYYTQGPGTEDDWRIRYGYTQTGATTPEADYASIKKIADESLEAGHEYSTDDDTYPAFAMDPRSNIYDLGDDPLAFAKQRTAYISSLWKNPDFEARVLGDDQSYVVLRRAMDTLLQQYGIASGFAVKYVGGQEMNRVRRGQDKEPMVPIPAAKQREALDFLGERVFAANAFQLSPIMLNRLAPDRWSHWGMNAGFAPGADRFDYDFGGRVLLLQTAMLNGLTTPALLSRLREAEAKTTAPFTLADHFDKMTKLMWGEVGGGSAAAMKALDGPNTRRDLQRAYIDRMANLVVNPPPGAPDDARALARLQLQRIDARCARGLAGEGAMGDATRAHLTESRGRIKRALEAGREADGSRAGASGSAFGVAQ